MEFAKKYMSITELTEYGLPRDSLKQYAHRKDSPAHKTPGDGKFIFDTDRLSEVLEKERLKSYEKDHAPTKRVPITTLYRSSTKRRKYGS